MNAKLRNLTIWIVSALVLLSVFTLIDQYENVPWFVSWLPFVALVGVWILLSRWTLQGVAFPAGHLRAGPAALPAGVAAEGAAATALGSGGGQLGFGHYGRGHACDRRPRPSGRTPVG